MKERLVVGGSHPVADRTREEDAANDRPDIHRDVGHGSDAIDEQSKLGGGALINLHVTPAKAEISGRNGAA
jgi:hypothetical protein